MPSLPHDVISLCISNNYKLAIAKTDRKPHKMTAVRDDNLSPFCHSFFHRQLLDFASMGLWHLESQLLCGRCAPTANQDITDRVHSQASLSH